MYCGRCSTKERKSRVFVDRVFTSQLHLEMYCLTCGKRWMFHPPEAGGRLALRVMALEQKFLNGSSQGR
jgi:hypothetical protein